MNKLSLLLITSVFLSACSLGNNNNKVTLINHEEDEEGAVIEDDISEKVGMAFFVSI